MSDRVPRTAPGEPLDVPPPPKQCPRCKGAVDRLGACRQRCDLDGRVVRQDGEHPTGGGAE